MAGSRDYPSRPVALSLLSDPPSTVIAPGRDEPGPVDTSSPRTPCHLHVHYRRHHM